MLLTELIKHPTTGTVADAKLTQKDFAIGCKIMKMDALNAEETEAFAAIGIDPRRLKHIPIAYGYELPFGDSKSPTTPEMDALKMRKGWDRASAEDDITTGMTYFARRIFGDKDPTSSGRLKRHQHIKDALVDIQRILQSNRPKSIVVVPSSSELPMMLANILATVMKDNGQHVEILDKNTLQKTHPKISHSRVNALGLDVSKITDYAANESKLKELKQQLATMSPASADYRKIRQQYDELEAIGAFQIKHHMGPRNGKSDFGKVYYGWIKAHDHDISTDVIIIDDNVVSGKTVGEAAKELIRVHKKPMNICGIALHMFITRKEKSEDASTAKPPVKTYQPRVVDVATAVAAGVLSKDEVDDARTQATANFEETKAKIQSNPTYVMSDTDRAIIARAAAFNKDMKELKPMQFAAKYNLPTYQPINARARNKQ